MIVMHK